jgi:LAO/AO transport system kinase
VTRAAHTTLVVVAPGLGDEVQAIKAGILEVADAFAVNKADRDGADAAARDLELMLSLGGESMRALSRIQGHLTHTSRDGFAASSPAAASEDNAPEERRWTPSIVKCVATRGEGLNELVAALDAHRGWLEGTEAGRRRRRERVADELRLVLREALVDAAVEALGGAIDAAVRDDPYTATERLVAAFRARP